MYIELQKETFSRPPYLPLSSREDYMSETVISSSNRKNPFWVLLLSFFLVAGILIETIPSFLVTGGKVRSVVNKVHQILGISQGDWPLFAPNPSLTNGMVVAEVEDSQNQLFVWSSRNWSESSVWEKFYRFRHMNYHQRVVNNIDACNDLADYLLHAIPSKEQLTPSIQFDSSGAPTNSNSPRLPIKRIRLYKHRNEISIPDSGPWASSEEIMWLLQSTFLCQREP